MSVHVQAEQVESAVIEAEIASNAIEGLVRGQHGRRHAIRSRTRRSAVLTFRRNRRRRGSDTYGRAGPDGPAAWISLRLAGSFSRLKR